MARKRLSKALKLKVLHDSAYVCALCQKPGCHIHHIDGDPSNNDERNLICICTSHHDEAHTKRELSRNITQSDLIHAKSRWNATVHERRELTASVSGQIEQSGNSNFASLGVTWGYINHRRVIQLVSLETISEKTRLLLELCIDRKIVDKNGILTKPANSPISDNYLRNSVYDWFEHGDDQRLHALYVDFVDQVSHNVKPVHLEREWWTKARIKGLLKPGSFLFTEQAFYFKAVEETPFNQHRRVHKTRKQVCIEFFIDSINMYGTTSMAISFAGHQSCGALLQVKSMLEDDDGKLIIRCTPIALGVAFNKTWQ